MPGESLGSQSGGVYLIEIVGSIRESDVNLASPHTLTWAKASQNSTTFSVTGDQAGLIGVLRYLHGMGFVLESLNRVEVDRPDEAR